MTVFQGSSFSPDTIALMTQAFEEAVEELPFPVGSARVQALDFTDEAAAVGTLKSSESVVLRPEVAGRVDTINFRDGAAVSRGTLLLTLDAAVQEAELQQAKAKKESITDFVMQFSDVSATGVSPFQSIIKMAFLILFLKKNCP